MCDGAAENQFAQIGMAELWRSWDRSRNEPIWKRGQRRRKAPNGNGEASHCKQLNCKGKDEQ